MSDPSAMSDGLSQLLSFALTHVPAACHASTPLYLLATAGVRALSSTDATTLLNTAADIIQRYPYTAHASHSHGFMFAREHVRLLSGSVEGLNGWIAINYLAHTLNDTRTLTNTDSDSVNTRTHNTIGVIEMGGASLQLTYALTDDDAEYGEHVSEAIRAHDEKLAVLHIAGIHAHMQSMHESDDIHTCTCVVCVVVCMCRCELYRLHSQLHELWHGESNRKSTQRTATPSCVHAYRCVCVCVCVCVCTMTGAIRHTFQRIPAS